MKTMTVRASMLREAGRLDSGYFLTSLGPMANVLEAARQRGYSVRPLGGPNGFSDRIHHPQRSKRALAAKGEPCFPYLRPYDVFNYYPEAANYVSKDRTDNIEACRLKTNQILQTCSGRNLGPAVLVDAYLAQFVMSNDMIRIDIDEKNLRLYSLAYLNSKTGRRMLRREKTGSVIDHLSEEQVARQEIVFIDSNKTREVAGLVERAFKLREEARLSLLDLITAYEKELPALNRKMNLREGWAIRSHMLKGRLDAAFYNPVVSYTRSELLRLGGIPVSKVARVFKPAGRYKTYYVSRDYGHPILSGAQLVQTLPINLQFISPRAFKDISDYQVHAGWIAYPADGRAEEELGTPVIITKDRDGWLASGHIGRVVPNPSVDIGWLFLALKTRHCQIQIKASASGSVVDSTFASDMDDVILPPPLNIEGKEVAQLWNDFEEAQILEEKASMIIDDELSKITIQ